MKKDENRSESAIIKTTDSKEKKNSDEPVDVQLKTEIKKNLPDTNVTLCPPLYSYKGTEYFVPEGKVKEFSISTLKINTKRTDLELTGFKKRIYDRKPIYPNLKITIDGVKRLKNNQVGMSVSLYKKDVPKALIQETVYEVKNKISIDWTRKVKELEPGGYFLWLCGTSFMLDTSLGWKIGEDLKVDFEVLPDGAELEHPEIDQVSMSEENFTSFKENVQDLNPVFTITLKKPLEEGHILSACCYNDDLFQMGEGVEDAYVMSKSVFILQFTSSDVWMPGMYSILLMHNQEPFAKFSFSVDSDRCSVENLARIERYDKDYMIARILTVRDLRWDKLSHNPSSAGLRKGIVDNLGSIGFNKIRLPYLLSNMYENLNYLIECRDDDESFQMIDTFCDLIANARGTETFDCRECTDKFAQDRRNAVIDECFDLEGSDSLFYLKNAGSLLKNGGEYMVSKMIRELSCRRNHFVLACNKGEGERLFDAYPALKQYFPKSHLLSMTEYTTSAIVFDIRNMILCCGMCIRQEAIHKIAVALVEAEECGTLGEWGRERIMSYVYDTLLPNFRRRKLALKMDEKETVYGNIEVEDVDADMFAESTESFEEAMADLNGMIGLGTVKHCFESVMNTLRMLQLRKSIGLKFTNETSHHMLFTGNLGTGKTTVAKMIGRIFKSLGLLSKGDVIVADRARMVGQWIGETERKMGELLILARGNVLFIDEAYSLCNGSNTDRRDYGYRVIECLMPVLASNNSDILVIMAGYPKEMDVLMEGNAGLKGRFPYRFNFEDYTAEELIMIGKTLLENNDYLLTGEAEQRFCTLIRNAVKAKDRNFSNARWVEQFIRNGIFPAMAGRIIRDHQRADKEYYRLIELVDIETAHLAEKEKRVALSGRTPIGYS